MLDLQLMGDHLREQTIRYRSTNQENSAFHPFGVDKCNKTLMIGCSSSGSGVVVVVVVVVVSVIVVMVSCNWMSAASVVVAVTSGECV